MADDRNADVRHRRHTVDHRRAPFQFHRMGSDLKKAPGIAKRLLLADLIGEKRHVADDQ